MGRTPVIVRPAKLSLREKHKRDKLRRINAAATKLFSEKGFEAATTREIAKRARVSQATVFQYAETKNELALLVFTGKLEQAHTTSFAALRPNMSLLQKLTTALAGAYQEFMKDPALSRALLKTAPEFQSGAHARRVLAIRGNMIGKLAEIVAEAKQSGVIGTDEDPGFVARDLIGSVHASVRFWLAKDIADPSEGLADLRRIVKLHIRALEPTSEALRETEGREAVS